MLLKTRPSLDDGDIGVAALSSQSIAAPKQKVRQRIIIEGDGDDQIAQFAEHLRKSFNRRSYEQIINRLGI